MNEITIDIEETAKFLEKDVGVIVLKRGDKKFYVRAKSTGNKDFPFELIPLSSEELKKIGIEESYQNDPNEDIETIIEESEQNTEKKAEHVDLTKEEDREKLKKTLEKAEKLFGQNQEKEKLEEENEDLKNKLGLIAEQQLAKKREALGLDPNDTMTPEQLMSYEKGLKASEKTGSPAGSAPMNSFQLGQQNDSELDILKRKFSSPEEMIMTLRREKTAQSEAILKKLFQKAIEANKQGIAMQYPPPDQVTKEGEARRDLIDPNSIHEENSELEKLGVTKNPLHYAAKNKEEFERLKKEAKEKRTK